MTCPLCHGSGTIEKREGGTVTVVRCPRCNGTGQSRGWGVVSHEECLARRRLHKRRPTELRRARRHALRLLDRAGNDNPPPDIPA